MYVCATEYSQKNFRSTLNNCEKQESLAQPIFPRLRYISNTCMSLEEPRMSVTDYICDTIII